ncbi:MAG TPA: metalloregulator ArsR/SmtB family transcription factor [Ilumatobacteraceae bacterium]|nr:metalloregulator ArsR/SmtB family transcription factor [Ilumatobacteraceae bacterium]
MVAYPSTELAALGDPTRRAIFERLVDGPRPVVDIARGLPVSRPAVSQHLKILKQAGLVTDRAAGTKRLYQVRPEGLAALRAYFDQFWNRSLAAFKQAAESNQEKQ